jgi:hypothetical protein
MANARRRSARVRGPGAAPSSRRALRGQQAARRRQHYVLAGAAAALALAAGVALQALDPAGHQFAAGGRGSTDVPAAPHGSDRAAGLGASPLARAGQAEPNAEATGLAAGRSGSSGAETSLPSGKPHGNKPDGDPSGQTPAAGVSAADGEGPESTFAPATVQEAEAPRPAGTQAQEGAGEDSREPGTAEKDDPAGHDQEPEPSQDSAVDDLLSLLH